jgi:hypothetical protein
MRTNLAGNFNVGVMGTTKTLRKGFDLKPRACQQHRAQRLLPTCSTILANQQKVSAPTVLQRMWFVACGAQHAHGTSGYAALKHFI